MNGVGAAGEYGKRLQEGLVRACSIVVERVGDVVEAVSGRLADERLEQGMIAHNRRNKLTRVETGLEILAEQDIPEPCKQLVSVALRGARGLDEDFRSEMNKGRPVHGGPGVGPVALLGQVESVVEMVQRTSRKGVRIVVDASVGQAPAVVVPPPVVEEALDNLISNAMAFTPADKTVTVSASGQTSGCVELVVRDGGPGFDAEVLQSLGRAYVSRRPGGTG